MSLAKTRGTDAEGILEFFAGNSVRNYCGLQEFFSRYRCKDDGLTVLSQRAYIGHPCFRASALVTAEAPNLEKMPGPCDGGFGD